MKLYLSDMVRLGRASNVARNLTAAVLLLATGLPGAHAQTSSRTSDVPPPIIEEVTVTATRRAEPLSKVAISVSTFSAEQMDQRGVKDFDDLVRLSPGLNLTRDSATGANQISIRGISSNAGSGTTGVYIDDTPIQVRNLGFGAGNAFPGLFDVDRVEVLRGPQGTLFGAGSEGGTVRFITTAPSLTQQSGYVRSELATMKNGAPTYEAGGAFGAPLINDELGFRISAFYRREGGWIDDVNGTYKITDPTGASFGHSVDFTKTSTIEDNANWNSTVALRGALTFQPTESLTITPSIFYQKHPHQRRRRQLLRPRDLEPGQRPVFAPGLRDLPGGDGLPRRDSRRDADAECDERAEQCVRRRPVHAVGAGIVVGPRRRSSSPRTRPTSIAPQPNGLTTPRATSSSTRPSSSSPPTA